MRLSLKVSSAILGLCLAQSALADAIGVGAGLHGVHIDYQKAFSEHLSGRVALTDMPFKNDIEEEGIKYEAEYDRTQVGIMLDYFPFAGAFHITGGLFYNDHEWDMNAQAQDGTLDVGDNTYDASDLGLNANVTFAKAEPYLGFGWGNSIGNSGIALNIDFGLLYLGSASVSYGASGTIGGIDVSLIPELNEDIEKERVELEEALQDFPFMPIIQLGIAYRF